MHSHSLGTFDSLLFSKVLFILAACEIQLFYDFFFAFGRNGQEFHNLVLFLLEGIKKF